MNNNIKTTLDQAKQEFINRGYIPLFDIFNNSHEKLLAKTNEGYKVVICLDKLKQGRNPSRFGRGNPYTIENIELYLKINNIQLKLLSNEFKNSLNNLEFITPEGYRVTYKLNDIKIFNNIANLGNPYSIDNIKKFLINNNIQFKLISKEYKGCFEKLELITKEGYKTVIKWASLKTGDIPDLFSKYNPYTIENIILWLNLTKSEYKLVSTTYKDSNEKLIFHCEKHGDFKISWSEMYSGKHGCKKCAIDKNKGENSWNWKGGISSLHDYLRHKIIDWKKESIRSCNYKCIITNANKNKIIHHLYSFDRILQETVEIVNLPIYQEINMYTQEELKLIEDTCLKLHYKHGLGVCLEKEIHNLFHRIYGHGNNTPEQFYEFKQRYYLGEFDTVQSLMN